MKTLFYGCINYLSMVMVVLGLIILAACVDVMITLGSPILLIPMVFFGGLTYGFSWVYHMSEKEFERIV